MQGVLRNVADVLEVCPQRCLIYLIFQRFLRLSGKSYEIFPLIRRVLFIFPSTTNPYNLNLIDVETKSFSAFIGTESRANIKKELLLLSNKLKSFMFRQVQHDNGNEIIGIKKVPNCSETVPIWLMIF